MGLYALVCLLPVLLVFIASISDDASLTQKGFSFFPTAFFHKGLGLRFQLRLAASQKL